MTARLFVICGLPGSGKTTLACELEAAHDAARFCPDEWMIDLWDSDLRVRIESKMWGVAQRLLRGGIDVVIEFGSWWRHERDTLREGARSLGVAVELHYLDVPVDELVRRLEIRNTQPGQTTITRAHIEEWAALIEVPTADERALFDNPLHRPG